MKSNSDGEELDDTPQNLPVMSVAVAFRLLDVMVRAGGPVRVSDLARELSESRAKIHRHLSTLKSLGIVDQEKTDDKYRLGWRLFQLGRVAFEQLDLKIVAEPSMVMLRDLTKQSVVLSVPSSGEAMIIASMESSSGSALRLAAVPGTSPVTTASAQGRISLAYATKAQKDKLLSEPIKSHNHKSITDEDEIRERLKLIRKRLYETSYEEVILGFSALAAPIFNENAKLAGTVGIIGSIENIENPPSPTQIEQVQSCAATISRALGSKTYEGVADVF